MSWIAVHVKIVCNSSQKSPGNFPDAYLLKSNSFMIAHPLTGLTCLLLLQVLGEALTRALDLPFPGPVTGMMLLLLALRWEPVQAVVSTTAPGLLSHLSLLFVPVGVGVMSHLSVISDFGWQIALVIVLSTWAGMIATLAVLRFGRDTKGGNRA